MAPLKDQIKNQIGMSGMMKWKGIWLISWILWTLSYWDVLLIKFLQITGHPQPRTLAPKLNALPKIVFSKTLEKTEWNNSRLISENIKEEILNIKQQPGKDLVLFGGADIASNLLQLGLIDEYRIILNPVVLSNGKPFFKNTKDKLSLNLLKTRTFSCGNVVLYYQPIVK
jgi:dihydrofolate reductase